MPWRSLMSTPCDVDVESSSARGRRRRWARRSAPPAGRTSCGSGRRRAMSSSCEPSSTTLPCSTHADEIGPAHGREAVRDEDRRASPCRFEELLEDLRLASHVELGGGLVEDDDTRAESHGAERASQRNALPLAAGQLGALVVGPRRGWCRARPDRRPGPARGWRATSTSDRARRCHVVAERQLVPHEVLEHGGEARAPRRQVDVTEVDAIDPHGPGSGS